MATISKDTAAVLVALLLKNKVPFGMTEYKIMSELDGTKGAGGFDHLFRPIKQRAKEIAAKLEPGAVATPVSKVRKAAGGSSPATPAAGTTKKVHKKAKAVKSFAPLPKGDADDDDDEEPNMTPTPPSKKVKVERDATPEPSGDMSFFEEAFNQ